MISFLTFMRSIYAPTFWFSMGRFGTIENYANSVVKYVEAVGDPPITELNSQNAARFIFYITEKGSSLENVRKHCRQLNIIFAKLGPPGPRNRDALGWLPIAPWIRPPQKLYKKPRKVQDNLVDNLYETTNRCPLCYEYPKYLDENLRPNWWKAFIMLATTTAYRRRILLGLKWSDIDYTTAMIEVPPELDKGRRERSKPLHPAVYRLLQSIRHDTDTRFLPWTHGNKRFGECWHALNDMAGIEKHVMPHDLKRYALQLASRSGVDAATLKLLGDHESLNTTLNHYVDGNLEEYVHNMRLPGQAPKENVPETQTAAQKFLFELNESRKEVG